MANKQDISVNEFLNNLLEDHFEDKNSPKYSKPTWTENRKVPPITAAERLSEAGWSPTAMALAVAKACPEDIRKKLIELFPEVEKLYRKWDIKLKLKNAEKEISKLRNEIAASPKTLTPKNFLYCLMTTMDSRNMTSMGDEDGKPFENSISSLLNGGSFTFYSDNPVDRGYCQEWCNHNDLKCVISEIDDKDFEWPFVLKIYLSDYWRENLNKDDIIVSCEKFIYLGPSQATSEAYSN